MIFLQIRGCAFHASFNRNFMSKSNTWEIILAIIFAKKIVLLSISTYVTFEMNRELFLAYLVNLLKGLLSFFSKNSLNDEK